MSPFERWIDALEARHLADLTRSEVTRALRALSSCYVERRAGLARGAALDGAGKRAAFALYYAPLHFIATREIVSALKLGAPSITRIVDLGCGTGAAGVAWAQACGAPAVDGVDRHPWAVGEANWTYRQFGVRGHARVGDAARVRPRASAGDGLLLAYAVNELTSDGRGTLLERVADAASRGARVLIVEPIARRQNDWWDEWRTVLRAREDEWRFDAAVPPLVRDLAHAAGLDPRELTARSMAAAKGGLSPLRADDTDPDRDAAEGDDPGRRREVAEM
jgi:SAM-dependent methyltransferase